MRRVTAVASSPRRIGVNQAVAAPSGVGPQQWDVNSHIQKGVGSGRPAGSMTAPMLLGEQRGLSRLAA